MINAVMIFEYMGSNYMSELLAPHLKYLEELRDSPKLRSAALLSAAWAAHDGVKEPDLILLHAFCNAYFLTWKKEFETRWAYNFAAATLDAYQADRLLRQMESYRRTFARLGVLCVWWRFALPWSRFKGEGIPKPSLRKYKRWLNEQIEQGKTMPIEQLCELASHADLAS